MQWYYGMGRIGTVIAAPIGGALFTTLSEDAAWTTNYELLCVGMVSAIILHRRMFQSSEKPDIVFGGSSTGYSEVAVDASEMEDPATPRTSQRYTSLLDSLPGDDDDDDGNPDESESRNSESDDDGPVSGVERLGWMKNL